ncbi:hypothetical protein BD410DRAFT_846517 [Rickenella mellea]|uniref:Ribonuclease H1 N-terminal domain-containing protein n=1 Tax=Rickenella mellea TaxID=50990 RepID=A0A4Y7PHN4_9AGAM|nr:hypothetical protein BD410DRAFT_846517 [Rickenella mellea]
MTASHIPSKAVSDDYEEDDERRNPGDPSRQVSTSQPPIEDQWVIFLLIHIIRAAVYSIGYLYHVGSNVIANIPTLDAFASPGTAAAAANVAIAANVAKEPVVPNFPIHMPDFDPDGGPDAHLGRRWYAVFVGREVGVFSSWDEVLAATSGVSGQSQRRFNSFALARREFNFALARGNVRHVPDEPEVPEASSSITKGKEPKRDDEGPGAAGGTFGQATGGCFKREE